MKKLLSNRTGFSLIEVLVAFAIFAIMASMILSILRIAIAARNSNNQYARDLAKQQEILVKDQRQKTFDSSGVDGQVTFTFEKDGNKFDVSFDYDLHTAKTGATDVSDGVNYFITDDVANPTKKPSTPSGSGDKGGTSQASRYDTRITGSKYFDHIDVESCQKYTGTGAPASGTRYIIKLAAYTTTKMDTNDMTGMYNQYKIYFRDDTTTYTGDVEKEDGKTYVRTYPTVPTILEVGYVEGSSGSYTFSTDRNPTNSISNPYKVTLLKNGGVQIGIDYTVSSWSTLGSKTAKTFSDGGYTQIYVDFATDPCLTTESFGADHTVGTYGGSSYSVFYEGAKEQPNIYGAFEYNDVEKTS